MASAVPIRSPAPAWWGSPTGSRLRVASCCCPARRAARSNAAIARQLVVSDAAVAKHIANVLAKLDLPPAADDHRRVLAVLAFLRSAG
jgi:hypothetical protein